MILTPLCSYVCKRSVDEKITKLYHQTPKKFPQEEIHHQWSTSSNFHAEDKGNTKLYPFAEKSLRSK